MQFIIGKIPAIIEKKMISFMIIGVFDEIIGTFSINH